MHRSGIALSFCCLMAAAGAFAQNSLTAPIRRAPLAEGCVNSQTSCGSITVGQVAPGDCVDSGGVRYDLWQFDGHAGDFVKATIFGLDPTFTNATLYLVPPAGDATTPRDRRNEFRHRLLLFASSGMWRVVATSLDAFASRPLRSATRLLEGERFAAVLRPAGHRMRAGGGLGDHGEQLPIHERPEPRICRLPREHERGRGVHRRCTFGRLQPRHQHLPERWGASCVGVRPALL